MTRVGGTVSSGLLAASARVEQSANNVANLNTDNFKARRVVTREEPESGVSYRSVPTQAAAPSYSRDGRLVVGSNTDVVEETVEQIGAVNAFKANLAVLRADNEMQKSLFAIKA
jgi:flagellar basal body rod protein FlgG